jgi:hypothetical protein
MILVDFIMRHLIQIHLLLPLFKPMVQSRSVGAEVCFIGDTNPIVTKSVCTAIGAIVDNDLIDILAQSRRGVTQVLEVFHLFTPLTSI